MSTLQALLFDVDGTLADTEKDGHRPAFNMAFAEAGLDWNWDEALYGELLAVTGGKERIRFYLEKFNTDFVKPDNFDEFVKGLHAAKTKFYTQLMAEGKIPLRTGVENLINQARSEDMRMAIVTTTTPANVTALLESTLGQGSEDWFEVIAAGDIVPAKKPAPDIYIWALEQMNLTANDAIAFEDSSNGIQSSAAANVKTIITINDYTKEDDFSAADLVLNQMGEQGDAFEVLAGDAFGHSFLDLELVKKVHAA
ncbi:HAD family hydrolase [Thiomicrorhabdus sediminis]|uniref:HAD family hydrolase n=1 Tax=Thiomicrorhabdus sediminis TaxID=2580412 RepID=A0A4P9K5R3_9GAMM|nr:HAD family hydrolase [Thiomicrorhabdus sediminis]QCU90151.1 HAD family hydrolase [Thiomicrorhabdus sediminis]